MGKSFPFVHETVVHMLAAAAARSGDNEALVCGEDRLSYREYRNCVAGFAAELQALGARGERVGLVLGNSLDMAIAYFAVHAAGAQAVPINPIYTARELDLIIGDAQPLIVLSFNPPEGLRKPGSVGIPVPATEIEIVDTEHGTTNLATGERGEIRARGPQIMAGYRNLPGETASALRDGWLYTGDIGEFDGDGYLFIRDRKKDMAIIGGYNVYPREIDEVLYAHPDVLEAACIGVPDAYRGEIIKAFVVARPGHDASPESLLEHCRTNLARYKVPAGIELVAALPKTNVGKIDKKALRETAR